MFKKLFQTIQRTLSGSEKPKPGKRVNVKRNSPETHHSLLDKISAPTPPPASRGSTPAPKARTAQRKSPEELCGISPKMPKEEIRARLALLYRRYNRASSSLDAKLRADAELMLDAIVAVRAKVFGPI